MERKDSPKKAKPCSFCGNKYFPTTYTQKCCSSKCKKLLFNREGNGRPKKECLACKKWFWPLTDHQVYCSKLCRESVYDKPIRSVPLPTGTVGAISELEVAADLMRLGWAVFRALSPHCFCDLIAFKGGITRYFEVRTGYLNKDGSLSFPIKARSSFEYLEYAVWVGREKKVVYALAKDCSKNNLVLTECT